MTIYGGIFFNSLLFFISVINCFDIIQSKVFSYLHKFYVVYYYNQEEGRIGLKLREDNVCKGNTEILFQNKGRKAEEEGKERINVSKFIKKKKTLNKLLF